MATADLKLVYGGGGSFTPSFFSGALRIATGSSGTLVTITPPAGKKVRLTGLATVTIGAIETGVSVSNSSGAIVSALSLHSSNSNIVGSFSVGQDVPNAAGAAGSIPFIDSISAIVIAKAAGNTAVDIVYSYAFGD